MAWKVLNYCLQKLHKKNEWNGTMHNSKLHRANNRRRLKENFLRHTKISLRLSIFLQDVFHPKRSLRNKHSCRYPSQLHVVVHLPCGNSIFRSRFIAKILERDIRCDSRRKRFGTVCSRHESLMGEARAEFLWDGVSAFRYPNILER